MAGVAVQRKVGTMAGLAVSAANRHGRGLAVSSPQAAIGVMAGSAGIVHLGIGRIDRNAGRGTNNAGSRVTGAGITVRRISDSGQMAGNHMAAKIRAMASLASATTCRPQRGLAGSGVGSAGGGIVAGRAGIMDLRVGRIDRNASGGANDV